MGDIFQLVISCINISYIINQAVNNVFFIACNDLTAGETFSVETVEYCDT